MGVLALLAVVGVVALLASGSNSFAVVSGKKYRFVAVAKPAPPPAFDANVTANLVQAGATNVSVTRIGDELRASYVAVSTATTEMKPEVTIGGLRFVLQSVTEV